jgi:hypothetical protein
MKRFFMAGPWMKETASNGVDMVLLDDGRIRAIFEPTDGDLRSDHR